MSEPLCSLNLRIPVDVRASLVEASRNRDTTITAIVIEAIRRLVEEPVKADA